MNFAEFIDQAWSRHATDTESVAKDLATASVRLGQEPDVPSLAHLIFHVYAEHLQRYTEGLEILTRLTHSPYYDEKGESGTALNRFVSALKLIMGQMEPAGPLTLSDRVRIYTLAAAGSLTWNLNKSYHHYLMALDLAESLDVTSKDPAFRTLAATSHNLMMELYERQTLNNHERQFMLHAAQKSRYFWGIAGTWLEAERAEYRLALCHLREQNYDQAQKHAAECLRLCQENNADNFELFFAFEVVARTERAKGNVAKSKANVDEALKNYSTLSDDNKKWCQSIATEFSQWN